MGEGVPEHTTAGSEGCEQPQAKARRGLWVEEDS
jgi:hypothetical protein